VASESSCVPRTKLRATERSSHGTWKAMPGFSRTFRSNCRNSAQRGSSKSDSCSRAPFVSFRQACVDRDSRPGAKDRLQHVRSGQVTPACRKDTENSKWLASWRPRARRGVDRRCRRSDRSGVSKKHSIGGSGVVELRSHRVRDKIVRLRRRGGELGNGSVG